MAVFYRHQITNVRVGVSKQVKENGYDTFYFYTYWLEKNIVILIYVAFKRIVHDLKFKIFKNYFLQ